ncbi:MAG: hypothetical protein AAGE59_16960 [Cyanobacteria bacterium P01_F01_bin.86]
MNEKRQKALEKLRANRGKERVASKTRQEIKADSVNALIRGYHDAYRSHKEPFQELTGLQATATSETAEKIAPEDLPEVAKAARSLQRKESEAAAAIERLKDARQRLKQVRKVKQTEPIAPTDETAGDVAATVELPKRQQVRQDLLTADFFKSASQWLNTVSADPRLSSSSVEEVETLYKEAKYRYKVLKIMLEDTQRELDSFEVYLRMAKSASTSE